MFIFYEIECPINTPFYLRLSRLHGIVLHGRKDLNKKPTGEVLLWFFTSILPYLLSGTQ